MGSKNDETPIAPTIEVSNLSASTKELTMNSIATQISTINVPFHGDNLYLVNFNGEPHVPMKPVVEGMGLAWQPQHEKLKTRFNKGITEIVIPTKGGEQSMTCLAFRKFAGWLHTINVGKVRPELREKVARYQEECDDVLYQYWTKGEVKNPRKKTTVDERTPLRDAVNMLVGKKGLRYDDAYTMVHQRFNIDSIDELDLDQIPLAVEYIHRVVLDGEFMPKQQDLPDFKQQFSDEEICSLAWLWLVADNMRQHAEKTYPALRTLESKYAGEARDIAKEFNYWLRKVMEILVRESAHITSTNTKAPCMDALMHVRNHKWNSPLLPRH
ncbi:phage antirepressor Ant [Citrobacter pasteurii]|uniref:Phage antirepressor Ant n=1 Tax=Citrobacter pasteurii TaxID=1563222 RepID=A0A6N6K8D6_9ENTR|nr:phage antirepressor N-terminal domain-containing protein [Citrobacter pasteurii]KAA1280245.1 phage antirepressor Ant [Citrobacter pasteurii]